MLSGVGLKLKFKPMSNTNETKIEELDFPQSFRLKRAVAQWNRAVDKSERIEIVADLIKHKDQLIDLFGVGKKTFQYLFEALNNDEPC